MTTVPRTGTEWLKSQARKVGDGAALPVAETVAATVSVEAWLQRHNVRYAPPGDIPLAVIDERRSRANQARRDAIVTESVERFAAALRAGAVFPPVVAFPAGGKLVLIDGNNRQAANRKVGAETIRGIVLAEDTPSELIALLTVEANAHHGVTPELPWRIHQAFHLCSLGFDDAAAAQAAAISTTQLRTARAVQEADQRARALRVPGFADLAQGARQSLNVLRDEAVFFQAAKVATETAMNTEEIRELVRALKALPSEGQRIEMCGAVADQRGIERATRKVLGRTMNRVSSPKQSLVAGIGKVLAVDEAALVRQIVTSHDRDQLNNRIRLLENKVAMLKLAMGTLTVMDAATDGQ